MSNIYSRIYSNLCSKGKLLKEHHKKGSNLHQHHIVPRHMGGSDVENNYTYLTVREHIIAHFLLWKIHRSPNDLRSMKMLGANLTYEQRRIVGIWCKENKIGWFNPEVQKIARKKAMEKQKEMTSENTFYYWSSAEGRKKRASLGGKASIVSSNNPWSYWASKEGQLKRSSLGGQSHKGKRCMYKPGDNSFKRVKPEDIDAYLENGYIFGSPIKSKNQYTKISS